MSAEEMVNLMAGAGLVGGIIGLAVGIVMLVAFWKIFSKAGYSGALALLLLVPVANIIVLCVLGFGDWPVLKELRQYRGPRG